MPKNVKGDPSGFINIHSVAKYQKTRRGDPLGTKKISKKSRTVPKKTQRGDPIVSSCFVCYDKNGLTERGDPLHYLKCAASILVVLYLVVER